MTPLPSSLVVATHNEAKLGEIAPLLAALPLTLMTLRQFPSLPPTAETASSYLENARLKARAAAQHCRCWALADDSGLEVEALDWQPGVHSARYAGEGATDRAHIEKLLKALGSNPDRRAVFRCTLVLCHPDGRELTSQGELWGEIAAARCGAQGFGYDPVFILPERGLTLAQLSFEEKLAVSHRSRAFRGLLPQIEAQIK